MAESVILSYETREGKGTRKAEKLRRAGKTPGVVYGHKEGTLSITVAHDALFNAVKHNVRVVDLQGPGKTEKALIKELQWDHLGKDILHVDFERVAADERIKVTVHIELRGVAPGVAGGGILDQQIHALHVECLAVAIPDNVRVPIGELQKGQAIHVRDLKLPEGVTVLDDPDAIVVHVTEPRVEVAAPTEEEVTGAEPEVIRPDRRAAEEGEEK
jgi:large subunit ribosomal protein L25